MPMNIKSAIPESIGSAADVARAEKAAKAFAVVSGRDWAGVADREKSSVFAEIRASLLKIGNKSITACYVMQNLKTGEVAATLEVVYVLFDVETRSGVHIGDDLRASAARYLEDQS